MDRIDSHLDKILAAPTIGEPENGATPHEQVETEVEAHKNDNGTENQLQDPERIQKKGRPEKPKRMKTYIEELKEKAKKKESKKKKTTNTENSGTKSYRITATEIQYLRHVFYINK